MSRFWLALIAAIAAFVSLAPAAAQYTATLPTTCRADKSQCIPAIPVVNPDGSVISGGGGTPTGTAGSPNAAVVSVQGITGGMPLGVNISQLNGGTIATGAGASNGQTQRVVTSSDSAGGAAANPSFSTGQSDQRQACIAGSGATCNTSQTLAANASTTPVTIPISATYGIACVSTGAFKIQEQAPDGSYQDDIAFVAGGFNKAALFVTAGPAGQLVQVVDTSGASNTIVCKATS